MKGLGLGLSLTGSSAPSEFDPASLAPLAYYDATDLANLFQDTGGTTPVDTADQMIKRVNDLSGNAKHLTQATNGPAYKTAGGLKWAEFDGVANYLSAAIVAAEPVTFIMAFRPLTATGNTRPIGGGKEMYRTATTETGIYSGGPQGYGANVANGTDVVITGEFNDPNNRVRFDGGGWTTGDMAGNAMTSLSVGADAVGAQNLNMRFARLIVVSGVLSASDLAAAEQWCAAGQGRTI